MTLALELGQVSDPSARRALEQISMRWPSSAGAGGVTIVASLPASGTNGQTVYVTGDGQYVWTAGAWQRIGPTIIQDHGVDQTPNEPRLNFLGAGVTVGHALGSRIDVTIPGVPVPAVITFPYTRAYGVTWDNLPGWAMNLRKYGGNQVVGEGLIRSSSGGYTFPVNNNCIMGFLPLGWRPAVDQYVSLTQDDTAGNYCTIIVLLRASDGMVQVQASAQGSNNGIPQFIVLNDLVYFAA